MTTQTEGPDAWLIRKGSYFYRPNCQGYTTSKEEAGRYTEAKAKSEASIEPWHMSAVRADDVPGSSMAPSFQARVQPWMMACFGPEISGDKLERGDRLLEEVLELLQSVDYPRERIASLASYVWSRPKGEPPQEVGGVEVTLAAFCLAHGLDKHAAGETELARIWTKVEAIRAKQAAKPTGSALPVAVDPVPAPDADAAGLFDVLRDESWDLRCFSMPTPGGDDADIGWRVIGHWMAEPCERVIAEWYGDNPAAAVRAAIAASRGSANDADPDLCPVCLVAFKPDDICASDISLGTCHAACLEGSPVVDLETGEPFDGEISTYRYGDEPVPRPHGAPTDKAGG